MPVASVGEALEKRFLEGKISTANSFQKFE